MTNEDNSNKRIIKRRRMIPKTDSDLENNNPIEFKNIDFMN